MLTPDDINIQDQRSSHAGSQQKKCSKYFKKENHNHNPPQSAHSPIPKSKIIFFLLNFQNIPNLLLFLRTLELCNAPRSILINQRRSKQNISREKETDCLFFPAAADQVDGCAVTGQCPLMVTVKSEQKTTRGLGETNKTIEISYMSSQDRMYLVSSTLACQRYNIQFLSIYLCIIYVLC